MEQEGPSWLVEHHFPSIFSFQLFWSSACNHIPNLHLFLRLELYLSELWVASDRDQFYKGVYTQKQEFISWTYCNTEARLHPEAQGILLGHELVAWFYCQTISTLMVNLLKCPHSTKDLGFPHSSRKISGNWLWLKCVSYLERVKNEMLDLVNLGHITSPRSGCKASLTQTGPE